MSRLSFALFLACVALLGWGCHPADHGGSHAADAFEAAKDAAESAYKDAESFDEKLEIARGFLTSYPESEDTGEVLELIGGDALEAGRPEAAYELADAVLTRIEDPKVELQVKMKIAALHGKTGRQDELAGLAAELAAGHELRYRELYPLMEAAVEAQAWELAIEQAETSLAFATAEAYKEDSPDVSDADAAKYGERRIAYSLANKGWAQFNLGRAEEAFESFESAKDSSVYNFLGVDDTPLTRYWGQALLRQGEAVEAMELLATEAIFGSASEALDVYREAYSACHDGADGFDEHLWDTRRQRARAIPDFELPDYDGGTVAFADFKGDVVLLAFWFPT